MRKRERATNRCFPRYVSAPRETGSIRDNADTHIQSASEFSSYNSIMSDAKRLRYLDSVHGMARHRRQGASFYDLVTIKITTKAPEH